MQSPSSWKPLLLGGASLVCGYWLLQHLFDLIGSLGGVSVAGLALLMLLRRESRPAGLSASPETTPLDRATVEADLQRLEQTLDRLDLERQQAGQPAPVAADRERLSELRQTLERTSLRLAVVGAQGRGRSTLLRNLSQGWQPPCALALQDTQALFQDWATAAEGFQLPESLLASELLLFVTRGELTASELRCLEAIAPETDLFLICTGADQLTTASIAQQRQQLQAHLGDRLSADRILFVDATRPEALADLRTALTRTLQRRTPNGLIWAALQRAIARTEWQVQNALFELRRSRALTQIEQAQWLAAGSVFLSPITSLDLLATAAVNARMVSDLHAIYRRPLDLEQGRAIALSLGELLLRQGLVEWSTQALAGLLKGHAVTFLAGGALQSVSVAYLTRVAGLSLVEFYRTHPDLDPASDAARPLLAEILAKVSGRERQQAVLQGFVRQAGQWLRQQPQRPQVQPAG